MNVLERFQKMCICVTEPPHSTFYAKPVYTFKVDVRGRPKFRIERRYADFEKVLPYL